MNKRPSKNRAKRTKPMRMTPADRVASPATASAFVARMADGKGIYAIAGAIIAVLCAMMYAWTADFPMEFDDDVYLRNNPLVQESKSFGYLLRLRELGERSSRDGFAPDLVTNFVTRPLGYASFHLNYLWDEYRPRWYRALNVVIHAVNGWLIFALVRLLLAQAGTLSRRSTAFIAGTAALLFVTHPMATESVTYIVQRFTSMGTMFYLATLCLYFAAKSAAMTWRRRWLRLGAVLALVMGMLTKEFVVTAPLVVVMLDWLVVRRHARNNEEKTQEPAQPGLPWNERLMAWIMVRSSVCQAIKEAAPLLVCLPVVPLSVVLAAWAQQGDKLTLGSAVHITNLNSEPWNHWHYFVTQFTVVMNYLRKLVWPSDLNLDPEWPLYESLLRGPVILAVEGIGILIGVAAWLFRRFSGDARFAMILAFVLWFFATIIVSSGLVPLPDLMAEHRSYLPSVGIFIAIACALDWLRCWKGAGRAGRLIAPIAAVLAVTALTITTVKRNTVWRTPVTLWEETVAKSPTNARVWSNLGVAYLKERQFAKSAPAFRRAIALHPEFETAYLNLASALNTLHRPKETLETLVGLEKVHPEVARMPAVLCTRSIALIESGKVDEGVGILMTLINAMPDYGLAHLVLAQVYSQTQRPAQALFHLRHARRLLPGDPEVQALMQTAELAVNSR